MIFFDASTNEVQKRADMIRGRCEHGACLVGCYVYVFGSYNSNEDTAEKYSLMNNTWEQLPNLTVPSWRVLCVQVKSSIYLAGWHMGGVLAFDINSQVYSHILNNRTWSMKIIMIPEGIYLISKDNIIKIDENGNILKQGGAGWYEWTYDYDIHKDHVYDAMDPSGALYSFDCQALELDN